MKKTVAVLAAAAMMALSGTALAETTAADLGGPGGDPMRGTAKADVMKGLGGDDALHSAGDGGAGYADCGAGTDTVKKGPGQSFDRFVGCERFVD